MRRSLWLLLFAFVVATSSESAFAKDKKKDMPAEERYELGLKYMRHGYYTKALDAFNRVRNYHRDDPISVKAELAIADVYFKKGDWEQARLSYEDFARLHPRHPDLDYVVWRIGDCLYKKAPKFAGRDQTSTRQAVNVWTGLGERFPDSKYKDDVTELMTKGRDRLAAKELSIATFYADRDVWLAARRRALGLVERYPDTKLVPDALLLAGQAYHAWGMETDAKQIRDRLAEKAPDSADLRKLDRVLARPPGTPPVEETFIRPYRVVGGGPSALAGGGGGGGESTP